MSVKITDKPVVKAMTDQDYIFGQFGGGLKKMQMSDFKQHINDNDSLYLSEVAFYIEPNVASPNGSTRVNTGGSKHMLALWAHSAEAVIMDKNGNYTKLNHEDNHFTDDGTRVIDENGALVAAYAGCDIMGVMPEYYHRIQDVQVGNNVIQRLWTSLTPLPGGWKVEKQVVGMFKASVSGGELRSVPNVVPANTKTIRAFWESAQARSKGHGLANWEFRQHLLIYMMGKYGWRDCQNCKTSDSTLVWGVGLDGTESTGRTDKFSAQSQIKTGATLGLGTSDGKSPVLDADGGTVHSVKVQCWENPWGQYWEMVQGLCSIGTDVYAWKSNMVPAGSSPNAATFAGIEHEVFTRGTQSNAVEWNMRSAEENQGACYVPKGPLTGVSYGDNFWYDANGQLWLVGGASNYGSNCGLACSYSSNAWTSSNAALGARLAYYGNMNHVTAQQLADLAA